MLRPALTAAIAESTSSSVYRAINRSFWAVEDMIDFEKELRIWWLCEVIDVKGGVG